MEMLGDTNAMLAGMPLYGEQSNGLNFMWCTEAISQLMERTERDQTRLLSRDHVVSHALYVWIVAVRLFRSVTSAQISNVVKCIVRYFTKRQNDGMHAPAW